MSNILKTREKGNLIVISGPSGAGKGTIIKSLLSSVEGVWLSISMTSREMRKGDIPDVSYYFVSKEEFEDRIKKGIFLGEEKKMLSEHTHMDQTMIPLEFAQRANIWKKICPWYKGKLLRN